jgi:SAM-dependent methyltransferase
MRTERTRDVDAPELTHIYDARFSSEERRTKTIVWQELARGFFQPYIDPDAAVVDLGAGSCEFINTITAREKIAVDLNPATEAFLEQGRFVQAKSTDLSPIDSKTIDVVFTSNFFEHLPDTAALLDTLRECHRILKPGGRLIVVMPNIRYVGQRYWDYLDHHLPLSHLSLLEGLSLTGFRPERVVPRFLPYTVKGSRLPVSSRTVRMYLRVPLAWRFVGRQMLIVAHT